MKNIIFLICMYNNILVYAQPYFVDTLNTLPIIAYPVMGNIFELPNNQGYAVSHFANYFLNIIYTDINGQRIGQKSWKIADSLSSSHSTRSCTKRADGSYLVVTQERGNCNVCDYGGIYCLSNDLQDTLWTKKIRYNYQSVEYPIFLDYVKAAPNNTIWAAGLMAFNSNVISHISHLSANGNIIAQNHFTLSTGRNFVQHLLPTPDGGCLIGLIEAGNSLPNTQQVAFLKVNAAGQQEWYKQYGALDKRDTYPFVLRAANPNEYWLVYTEGTNTSTTNFRVRIKGIRVNSTGAELQAKYLAPYTANSTEVYDAYQDADGSVIFGIKFLLPNNSNYGHLWKFSPNMDSLWRKQLPAPNYNNNTYEGTYPYHIIKTTNSDIITSGIYYLPSGNDAIFITRLDSAGCLVVGTEAVAEIQEKKIKVFPNPVSNILNIETPENIKGNLYLYNALGQMVKQINIINQQTQLNTYDIPNGIYFLTVVGANGRFIGRERVVVQHE